MVPIQFGIKKEIFILTRLRFGINRNPASKSFDVLKAVSVISSYNRN